MNEIARAGLLLLLALGACAKPEPARAPLAGARIGGPFTLTDEDGRAVTDRRFAGRYRIVYFGYTYCPDVCPRDAQNIGAGLRIVERDDPALGQRIVPLFITVDPARDTPAKLKEFTAAFHPRMIGLTGTAAQIAAVAKAYGVYAKRGDASPSGGYLVDHTDATYLMDPEGKPLALLPSDQTPQAVATEIEQWAR